MPQFCILVFVESELLQMYALEQSVDVGKQIQTSQVQMHSVVSFGADHTASMLVEDNAIVENAVTPDGPSKQFQVQIGTTSRLFRLCFSLYFSLEQDLQLSKKYLLKFMFYYSTENIFTFYDFVRVRNTPYIL